MKVQQFCIQPKLAAGSKTEHLLTEHSGKPRLSVGSQPHYDVLVLIRREPKIRRHRGVELAERMGQRGALQHANLPALPGRQHGRMRLGCAVHDENRRALERRDEKGARGMAEMMIEKHRPVAARTEMPPEVSRKKSQFRP